MNKIEASYYLSGMIDGEGHISFTTGMRRCNYRYKKQTPYKARQVVIYNCDVELIDACIECLLMLDIPFRYYCTDRKQPGWNSQHEVRVTRREGFVILNEVLHLKSKKKKAALREIVRSYEKSAV